MTRQEWLEARKRGLGGSDAAAVLGLNPWKTNVALWEEKTGRREAEDISNKECVQYGVACEPLMRDMFKLDFPSLRVSHEENSIISHQEYPFLKASLDGRLVDANGSIGVLEIKTTTINRNADWVQWSSAVPQNYFIQLLHYMLVTEAAFAILKARLKKDWGEGLTVTERHYRFDRTDHEADIAYLLEKELAFWRLVETDTRPDLILPEI